MSKYRQSCSMTSSSICLHDNWLSRLSGPNQLEVLPSWRARTALGVSLPHPQSSSRCLRSHSRARWVLTSAATRCAVGRGSETNKQTHITFRLATYRYPYNIVINGILIVFLCVLSLMFFYCRYKYNANTANQQ